MEEVPLVSIACITYNHIKFISEAIEGFLMQKTSFPFEIVIHDDCSTDGTTEIIRTYEEKYPALIRIIYQSTNQYSSGKRIIPIIVPACKGKYVALCEGDDYWTDPLKLQKQVDFLEANPDFVITFHKVYELKEGKLIHSALNLEEEEKTYSILDLAKGNLIHTPSVLFRNHLFESFPEWFDKVPAGDYVLHMLNAKYGLIKYFPQPMAVYRIHEASMWSSQNRTTILERWLKVLDYLLNKNFGSEILSIIRSQKRTYVNELLFIYFESDTNLFLEKLKVSVSEDPEIGMDWLFCHYPQIAKKYQNSLINIKQSRTYRLSLILSSLKTKFLK